MFRRKQKQLTVPRVRRTAGQSLRDEKERLFDDRFIPYFFGPAIVWMIFITQAFYAATNRHPEPVFWLALAIIATAASAIGFWSLIPQFRNLNRGERGERRVAEILQQLRRHGYRSFDDLQADGFNIDHVVVGPSGVYAIETKFRSGRGQIDFRNGEGLFVDGIKMEKDVLAEARRNAAEINRIIKEHCGIDRWVKPLVVFVGDWRITNWWDSTDARVLSERQLGMYFTHEDQPELKRSEIELIASHLARSTREI